MVDLFQKLLQYFMPHIVKPMEVHHHSEKVTSGEFTINLNLALTIKLDESGKMEGILVNHVENKEEKRRNVDLIVLPDVFVDMEKDIIKFGEDVK